jgi:pimeloyl-ACP methyl ester carboxylesterase
MTRKNPGRFAKVNGIQLHYVGMGKGPLILFLHGFPEFWAAWEEQLSVFSKDHQAVAPDMRGYNLSDKPAEVTAYHVNTLMEDLRQLAAHLGHASFTLVAHDWGGAVAWSLAARHPELIEKLVIINSPHPLIFARELLENPEQQKASEYMRLFRSKDAEQILSKDNFAMLREAIFNQWGSKWKPGDEELQRYIDAWSQPGALTGGLNYYRASPLYPPKTDAEKERLHSIAELSRDVFYVTVPTLVIWGERDTALLTGNLEGLEEMVADLRVERLPEATHWVVHEEPTEVNRMIREFIDTA